MKPSNKYAAHTQHHFGVNFNSIGSAVPEIYLKTRDIPKIVPSFPFKCYRKYFIVRSDKLCHISNSTVSISTGQKALCMGIRAECSCHRNNASAIKQKILPVSPWLLSVYGLYILRVMMYRSLGNFRGKKNRVTIFRELIFRFRGHPRKFITGFIEKIYRKTRWTSTEEL